MSWLFPYPGGKHLLASFIIKHLPSHRCLVEVFGGSAALLLSPEKPPSPVEVWNDVDGDMVNFFRVVRESGTSQVITDRLRWIWMWMPMAREEYETWLRDWRQGWRPQDAVDRAAVWFFLQCNSINGRFGGGWTHGPNRNEGLDWKHHVERVSKAATRLRRVQIEHQDFGYIIGCYDSLDTVFYCDPPYLQETLKDTDAKYYAPMSMERHKELARLLNSIQGKAIVSYYPHPILDEWYPAPKWRRRTVEVPRSSDGTDGRKKSIATELLLFNYGPLPMFQGKDEDWEETDTVSSENRKEGD